MLPRNAISNVFSGAHGAPLRLGKAQMSYIRCDDFGVEMEILADGCSLEFEEYRDLYHSLFGASAHGRIKLKTPLPQASKK